MLTSTVLDIQNVCGYVTGWGPGPEQDCLGPASSVWVLDFVQERFHITSLVDFESMFIKFGTVK